MSNIPQPTQILILHQGTRSQNLCLFLPVPSAFLVYTLKIEGKKKKKPRSQPHFEELDIVFYKLLPSIPGTLHPISVLVLCALSLFLDKNTWSGKFSRQERKSAMAQNALVHAKTSTSILLLNAEILKFRLSYYGLNCSWPFWCTQELVKRVD